MVCLMHGVMHIAWRCARPVPEARSRVPERAPWWDAGVRERHTLAGDARTENGANV
jgi:hypothetical protein